MISYDVTILPLFFCWRTTNSVNTSCWDPFCLSFYTHRGKLSSNFPPSSMGCAAMTALKGPMNLDKVDKFDQVGNVGRQTNLVNLVSLVNLVKVLVSLG